VPDPVANNVKTVAVQVVAPQPPTGPPAADIAVTKEIRGVFANRGGRPRVKLPEEGVAVGDTVIFRATIANRGPGTATNVVFTDAFTTLFDVGDDVVAGTIFTVVLEQPGINPLNPPPGAPPPCYYTAQGDITCSLGEVAARTRVNVLIVVDILRPGWLLNTLVGRADQDQVEEGNNVFQLPVLVRPGIDISLTLTSIRAFDAEGKRVPLEQQPDGSYRPAAMPSRLVFRYQVTNNDTRFTALRVRFIDELTAGDQTAMTTHTRATDLPLPACQTRTSPGRARADCLLGNLEPGQSREVVVTVGIQEQMPVIQDVHARSVDPDPNPANNSVGVVVVIPR
jgi:hypothetical protein